MSTLDSMRCSHRIYQSRWSYSVFGYIVFIEYHWKVDNLIIRYTSILWRISRELKNSLARLYKYHLLAYHALSVYTFLAHSYLTHKLVPMDVLRCGEKESHIRLCTYYDCSYMSAANSMTVEGMINMKRSIRINTRASIQEDLF